MIRKVVLISFLVVTATTTMVTLTMSASRDSFGPLPSTIMTMRGTGYLFIVTQVSAGVLKTIRETDFLFVV